jgi:hypothetical protein
MDASTAIPETSGGLGMPERKINRLARRQTMSETPPESEIAKPGEDGTLFSNIGDYDDDFPRRAWQVIAHDKGCLRLCRARNFEALREYLRVVRRRARDGEMAAMWRELAQGAAHERDLGG